MYTLAQLRVLPLTLCVHHFELRNSGKTDQSLMWNATSELDRGEENEVDGVI